MITIKNEECNDNDNGNDNDNNNNNDNDNHFIMMRSCFLLTLDYSMPPFPFRGNFSFLWARSSHTQISRPTTS